MEGQQGLIIQEHRRQRETGLNHKVSVCELFNNSFNATQNPLPFVFSLVLSVFKDEGPRM